VKLSPRARPAVAPLIALGIFLLNAFLNRPLFLPGEMPFRGSIEGGYAAMARFVAAHPNPWGWNPFQYCGLATQFMYVPLLPYSAALWTHVASIPPEYAHRLLTAIAACAGPVALFFFVLYFTGSRRWAIGVALAYSLFSPAYGLFPQIEKDRGIMQLPWRIQVLAKYGEGPHVLGLALLLLALLALWIAGKRGGFGRIAIAAMLLAAIPLANWLSAFSLAIACALLLLAAWGEPEFRVRRPLAAAALAYLLASFWLTPSFIRTIAFNWPADSFGYHFDAPQRELLAGLLAGLIVIRLVGARLRASFYFTFTILCAFAFGWIATFYYLGGIDTVPESRRYAIEFELFLALAIGEALRLTLRSKDQTVRMCAIGSAAVMLLVGTPQLWAYLTPGREIWSPAPPPTTIEYRLAQWLAGRHPMGRVFASGGLRFRLNSWFDVAQVGGGFETGLRNRMPLDLAYHIRTGRSLRPGREAADTILELQALGVEYVVTHGPKSKEYYRDYAHPERLDTVLPAVYREDDNSIYQLPARPLAHALAPEDLPGDDAGSHPDRLERYVAALGDTLRTHWLDPARLQIEGPVPQGRVVAVQVNADPGWEAWQNGRTIPIETDRLGFMTLRAASDPAAHIELRYRGTAEQRIMAAVSALTWLAVLAVLVLRKWKQWQRPSGSTTTN
jgi:hypothetical protein